MPYWIYFWRNNLSFIKLENKKKDTSTFLLAFASSESWTSFMIVFKNKNSPAVTVALSVKSESDHSACSERF